MGEGVERFKLGDRVGVPWLGWTCGVCEYCRTGRENLCDQARFTGYTLRWRVCRIHRCRPAILFSHPGCLCRRRGRSAALRGTDWLSLAWSRPARPSESASTASAPRRTSSRKWRAFRDGRSTHLRSRGDQEGQAFARSLGAVWAGDSDTLPPEKLDAAIIFAPAGELVPLALKAVRKGGTVVCGGIHMSDIPAFPYELLWEERSHLFRGQPHAPGWGGVLCPGAPRPGAHHCANVSAD